MLLGSPESTIATTMLIAPMYTGSISQFYELYVRLTEMLDSDEAEEIKSSCVQPAFFHPGWTFDGVPAEAPLHYEKRAPCPVVNLLRRSAVERVVADGAAKGVAVDESIAAHNARRLEDEGTAALDAMFRRLSQQGQRIT